MLETEKNRIEFEEKYVYNHGYYNLNQMISNYIEEFVENDPRAFTGFNIFELTLEFMHKYNIPTDDQICFLDILSELDEEAWNY